jgi:hypothetical protein
MNPAERNAGRIPGPPGPDGAEGANGSSSSNGGGFVNEKRIGPATVSSRVTFPDDPEFGRLSPQSPIVSPGSVKRRLSEFLANPTLATDAKRPALPAALYSPVHILSVFSFLLTLGLMAAAVVWRDGNAILAIFLISMASSVVGYASWWQPILMNRSHTNLVPPGDMIIRTREGAFVLVRCTEEVARELYSGTEECKYHVSDRRYPALMALGTVMLMLSVVLLGNCTWNMQIFIAASYIVLNGLYWAMGLLPKEYFWDLSRYTWEDATPEDALGAHDTTDPNDPREGAKSFTRTLWYAIRETKRTGWVERSGAAPGTPQWKQWLREAEQAANDGDRTWPAVARKNVIMKGDGKDPEDSSGRRPSTAVPDPAEQHAPYSEVQPRAHERRSQPGSL